MRELKDALRRVDRATALVCEGLEKRGYSLVAGKGPTPPVEWTKALADLGQTRTSLVALRAADQRDAAARRKATNP